MSNEQDSRSVNAILRAAAWGMLLLLMPGCAAQAPSSAPAARTQAPAASSAPAAGGIPRDVPGNYEVHADQGGPVYINGQEAALEKFSDTYFEARGSGITVSLTRNPDGSSMVSYTGAHGVNGVCQVSGS